MFNHIRVLEREHNNTMLSREQLLHYAQRYGAHKAQALQCQQVRAVIQQQAKRTTGSMQAALVDLERQFAILCGRHPLSYIQEMIVLRARMLSPYASSEEIRIMYRWVIEQLAPLPAVRQSPLPPVAGPSCQPPSRSIGSRSFWVILVEKADARDASQR